MVTKASIARPAGSAKVIGLVSTGHFFSHFYMLLLPPLFPMLRDVYGVGFTELGLAITAFSVTTGLTQAPVGFLVDRYGARGILIAGVIVESVAIALIGVFPVYSALVILMVAAGLANAVYHPADYVILHASVAADRMGRAFSVHTFAGYLGTAVAPVTMIFLMSWVDWRTALFICGAAGVAVGVVMALNSEVLLDATGSRDDAPPTDPDGGSGLRLLFSAPILMGLAFFAGLSMIGHGIGDFTVSALNLLYDAPLATAGVVLSAFLFASPLGVLMGGWVADRTIHHDRFVALCLAVMAVAMFLVAALEPGLAAIGMLFVVAGLANGLVAPCRDMLIRSLTPEGSMGKVFGFVSTGYNVGGVLSPVMFGYLLDHADPGLLFWAAGVISVLTVVTVLATGRQRPVTPGAAARQES